MKSQTTFLDAERETRIFFWFMTLVLVGMYVWVLATQPETHQPLRFLLFTGLMFIHIILHWSLRYIVERPGWIAGYMVVQGVLALALVLTASNEGLIFSLFLALIGEAVGVYGLSKRSLAASLYFIVLSLGSFVVLFSPNQFPWWLLGIVPMFIFVVLYVELYNRQVNANERARVLLNELETANRQLTEYAAQVEDLTIVAERQRMARELHDTLSQGLAGLILQLEAVDAHLSGERPHKAHQIVQQTMENARTALANARRAIDNLRAGDTHDLDESIHTKVSQFTAAAGVPCALEMIIPPNLPAGLTDPIVRIVAEGLTNIAQHARAAQASLHVKAHDGALLIEICDDGASFDPAGVPAGHYGLIGMRERARLAGGVMEVESIPGKGTRIKVKLPIP